METKTAKKEVEVFENEWVTIEKYTYHLYVAYKPIDSLELESAKKIIEDSLAFTQGKIYPVLTDIKHMPSHSKEVRDYLAGLGSKSAIANGILVSNAFNRILTTLFLALNKPLIPTRIFNDRKKAVEWLEKFSK